MNILKRETVRPCTLSFRIPVLILVYGVLAGVLVSGLLGLGYRLGVRDARMNMFTQSDPVTESRRCGITDALACVTMIADRIGEALRPGPEMIVTIIEGASVICADAERAYWACANDASCPLETFERVADDVNLCQTGH